MKPLEADDPRVIGEFRLHARLGAGGMGRVYLGSSPGGRAVAVKAIHPHLARDPAFADRFRREVAAALAVNGGYAAPVVAAGADDDPPWLASGPALRCTTWSARPGRCPRTPCGTGGRGTSWQASAPPLPRPAHPVSSILP